MKYIKLFEESSIYGNRNTDETSDVTKLDTMPLRSPVYQKGEIIIWSDNVKNRDVDYDFAEKLLRRVCYQIEKSGKTTGKPQNHRSATYSLWRDEEDFQIDWSQSAEVIVRHIHASSYPYVVRIFTCRQST